MNNNIEDIIEVEDAFNRYIISVIRLSTAISESGYSAVENYPFSKPFEWATLHMVEWATLHRNYLASLVEEMSRK